MPTRRKYVIYMVFLVKRLTNVCRTSMQNSMPEWYATKCSSNICNDAIGLSYKRRVERDAYKHHHRIKVGLYC
jgi:hypothetical protein